MPKILIIGGGGYIGSMLTQELKKAYQVTCFDRFSDSNTLSELKSDKNIRCIAGDVNNINSEIFANIDKVIDLVAITKNLKENEAEVIQVNKNARRKIIEIAKKSNVSQYIRISSSNIYAGNQNENSENEKVIPRNLYAKINLELDKYAISMNNYKFVVTVLRLPSIFGYSIRMRWDQSINNMIKNLHHNNKIEIKSKKSRRPFLHIKDAINAVILILNSEKEKVSGEIFNVGSNEQNYTMEEIAKTIQSTVKSKPEIILNDEKDENSFTMNCDKIKKLGFKKNYNLEYGINEILQNLNQKIK